MKIHFVTDNTTKAQSEKKIIFRKYKNYFPSKSNIIVVIGGDGFMLKNIKKLYKYNKPFYGINCGSYGFLMNNLDNKNLISKILKTKKSIINPLSLSIIDKNKNRKKFPF